MLLGDLPKQGTIYLENFVNQRDYSKFCNYTEVTEKFRPGSGFNTFRLPYVDSHANDLEVASSSYETEVSYDKFFLHPDACCEEALIESISEVKLDGPNVLPTASSRTLLVCDSGKDYYIKLHLPKRISRYNRRLRASSIRHSIHISKDLEEMDCPRFFAFLPEVKGVINKKYGFGYIIRISRPYPFIDGERYLIPYFSLYSYDEKSPEDLPLLVQLINTSADPPDKYLKEKVLGPLVRSWGCVASKRGILLESHGQNSLLEVNKNLIPKRFIARDFQSLMVEPNIRESRGLATPFKKHVIGSESFSLQKEFSLTYDYFIFHHMVQPLVRTFCKHFDYSPDGIYRHCKNMLEESFPDYKKHFPKGSWYRLKPKPFGECDNKTELEEVKGQPLWR